MYLSHFLLHSLCSFQILQEINQVLCIKHSLLDHEMHLEWIQPVQYERPEYDGRNAILIHTIHPEDGVVSINKKTLN